MAEILMDNNLTAMSVFVQAADTRSFTKTGNQLGVSSSVIGKTNARLEERLGVRLFHRNTRSITLTPDHRGRRASGSRPGRCADDCAPTRRGSQSGHCGG